MNHYLTVKDGKLMNYPGTSEVPVVMDEAALRALFADPENVVLASSSLDFPEEYTSDPEVLALVALLDR